MSSGAAETGVSQKSQGRCQTIYTRNTIITPKLEVTFPGVKREQVEKFTKSVNSFAKGQYILFVDKPKHVMNIDALSHVQWCAVYDLDQQSGRTGLLSRIGKSVSKHRLLTRMTWQETKCSFTETSLNWIGMTGSFDRPDSMIDDDFLGWKRKVKTSFSQQLGQLNKFSAQYTTISVVVLWPEDVSKIKHMHYMIDQMIDEVYATVVILLTEDSRRSVEEESLLNILAGDNNVTVVNLNLDCVCAVIQNECMIGSTFETGGYQLPTSDTTNNPGITDREFQWMREDLDVLYLNDHTGVTYTAESLKDDELTFHRGGTLPWSWWYTAGPGRVDIERDIHREIVNHIQSRHIQQCRPGYIKLYHNPGAGGTTAAQRIVWELKDKVPCLQIKHRNESQAPELFEKVKLLYDKVHLPIVILVDGEDEHKADCIYHSLREHVCIIVLYVQRYWATLNVNRKDNSRGMFWLRSSVSNREVLILELMCTKQCSREDQKRTVHKLASDVQRNLEHTFIDFGLAVHGHEYTGVHKYVAGYLKLSEIKTLQPWHKALGYLSLVYFYGQSSLPCYFFTGILGKNTEEFLGIDDFPLEMKQLIVIDVQERKRNVVRISHFEVAKEILNQLLPFPKQTQPSTTPNLSVEAKRKLADLCIEFIIDAGVKNRSESSSLSYIMRKTFIIRHNKAVGETETQAGNKKTPSSVTIARTGKFSRTLYRTI